LSSPWGYGTPPTTKNPEDLRLVQFRATLVYAWHLLVEGMKRLGGGQQ
jgi:hypothetical protein